MEGAIFPLMEAELQFTSAPLSPPLPIVDAGQHFRRWDQMAPSNGGDTRYYFYLRLPSFKVEQEVVNPTASTLPSQGHLSEVARPER